MTKKVSTLILVFLILGGLGGPTTLMAQDEGQPAMRTMAYFSFGGGAAGAGLGAMIWLLDPLNPSADFTNSTMTGFAVGVLAGAIFGGMQLQKQAVFPYSNAPLGPSEFQGGIPTGANFPQSPALPFLHKEKGPRLPLAAFNLRF